MHVQNLIHMKDLWS